MTITITGGCFDKMFAVISSHMNVVESSPEIMGGTPVFAGTRVPVETLMDYLEAGDSINEFLSDFPTVSRQQVIEALAAAKGNFIGAAK